MLISSATAMDASNRQVEPPLTGRFVTAILPWLAGCGGLLLYLLTLNTWVSLYSLANVARVSGWLWRPELGQPLTQAICYPFHWLPGSWIPVALNVFTAACAALVLAQLARSVALLPHDLTPSQPFATGQPVEILAIPTSWMPPVLAAMLCGLQLTFWEHATCASGEMIDLFLFAFVIRCLLEFRIDQKQAWLSRAAFVYATGMANDWAFVGYLPILVAAIVRTKGLGAFLDRRFLLRMSLWGLAGLSLYLLVPLAHLLAAHDQVGFWTALQANLHSQKNALAFLRRPAFRLLIFASLLPLVVLSVRWKAHSLQFADDSRLGVFLRKTTSHLLHGCFFALSLWLALDPSFSPRNLGLGTSMLTYYYSLSLVFGYCAGYFLLLGTGPGRDAFHRCSHNRSLA